MANEQDKALRKQLVTAVRGGEAHLDAAGVFDEIRDTDWGTKLDGAPHTLWQLLEHTGFTLHDLYVFSTDAHYKAPDWPRDYWPQQDAPENAAVVKQALASLKQSQDDLAKLIDNPETDLYAKVSWGDGQTILREAVLAATHTSYHLGQAMFLRKQLEARK